MIPERTYGKVRNHGKPVLDWRKQAKTCRFRSPEASKNPHCLFGCSPKRCTYERCQRLIEEGMAFAENLKRQLDEEDELDRS